MITKYSNAFSFLSPICLLLLLAINALPQTTVTTLEDPKAMGYPDARKSVRDASGNLFVAYRKKLGSAYQVYVSKSTNGGTSWTVTNGGAPVSTVTGSCNQRVPAIAIDSANTLHVVWYGLDSGCVSTSNNRQIKYTRSTNGGSSWTANQNIANVLGYMDTYVYNSTTYDQEYWQEHPVIYIDGTDNLFVVWEGRDTLLPINVRTGQVKFIKSTNNGATWTAWKNIAQINASQSRPTIVVDTNGKIFVFAYSKLPGTNEINIVSSTSTDGGTTFTAWAAVAPDSIFEQRHSSAAIDSGNKIHLVWRQEDSTTAGKTVIKYSKFTSPTWSAPVTVSASSSYYQFFPSIANRSGSQYIVWTESLDESGYISESGSEEPVTGKIVIAQKLQGTPNWTKSDLTAYGTNTWGSVRWSSHRLNGGTIDVTYSSGSANPYSLRFQSYSSPASLTGRVLSGERGVPNAQVVLTEDGTSATILSRTNPLGFFRFYNINAGQSFVLQARSKSHLFEPQSIAADGKLTDLEIFAQQ